MKGLLWLLRKYYNVLIFIFLETIAIILLNNNSAYQRSILVNAHREVSGTLYSLIEGGREYLYLKKNNEMLVRENTLLRNQLESLADTADTSQINVYDGDYFYTPARIVHATFMKQRNYITIDKGHNHGISGDMAVISDKGIVGIVLESSSNFSTIIPVINRDFRLSVKTKKENFSGILHWNGNSHRTANLTEIPYHAELETGDTIVTSGYSAIFPEGLFVGTIENFQLEEGNFYQINVLLGTNYQQLFHVNVITNYLRKEQLELEEETDQ